MTKDELLIEAKKFRNAIIKAKEARAFSYTDRMSGFPRGCCDDTADLFAHYLYQKYGIVSLRVDGSYHDGDPEHNCGHSWQEVEGLIIDLTGDQFKYDPVFLNYDQEVYIGRLDKFHALFEVEYREPSYGIESLGSDCWNRMRRLYNTIVEYIE